MKSLKRFARFILKDELVNLLKEKEVLSNKIRDTEHEKEKLERKIKRPENPEDILLSYYRIDNAGANGMPPSYLNPKDQNDYTQRIHELESIYRNRAFREMMAWSLNFHANMAVSGKIRNERGDEIDIPTEHAIQMISGIKAIWQLVVNAHKKDIELTETIRDPYDILDESTE